ncbi:MAG: MG2 domain-containing protein, partial [Planctomycetota bacterium]
MQPTRTSRLVVAASSLAILALLGPAAGSEEAGSLARADALFEKKSYRDAAAAYQEFLRDEPRHPKLHHASRRLIACRLRLQLFDPALEAAERYVERTRGTPYEARTERLAGNLYLTVPHWGTRAGGKFHRAQWKQGIQVRSYRHDKRHALRHLQRARELYARYDAPERAAALAALPEDERPGWHDERLGCLFDLAGACARFGIYENQWFFWYSYWGERDEFLASTAGEDDFDEYHSWWRQQRKRPIGLRVGPDGRPRFASAPKEYAPDLSDDRKVLFLLAEARRLDRTDNKRFTALSWYRQAMLARARFGMDRLNSYAGLYWWGGRYPLKEELGSFNPWELGDGEALVLVGGRIRKVQLPRQWDVLGLLRTVEGDYRASGLAAEAQYSIGLYHQSRQQYTTALGEYQKLEQRSADSRWAGSARQQVARIRQPQVRISQTGVQLPGEPARIQLSYRNTSKVWFVARSIDHEGFMREIRRQGIDSKGRFRNFHQLRNWHSWFVNGYDDDNELHRLAARYTGREVARWADPVQDDGTHRYATATLQTPLRRSGAYLVHAYLREPPKDDARRSGADALRLGDSRAVVALTDLAIVDKRVERGNLYFVCDAQGGAPVPQASVEVLEVWSTYDRKRRRSFWHWAKHDLTTDEQGLAQLERTQSRPSQLHLLVRAGSGEHKRLAWSGMSYWSRYNPSRMRDGLFAYCITDRPVYRPAPKVRFKVWLRRMRSGILENQPDRQVQVIVYDPRGNKVYETTQQTDQYGGLDGELTLGEEPPLGVYRIYIAGQSYVGGQNFRVEEYRKPEFEVGVAPGKTHTRLGDEVTARIRATYFFGGPVTEATVKYKVFREEYRHRYYFPGRWDWLYGP